MKLFYSVVFLAIFIFSGCSTKEVYEPKLVVGEWKAQRSSDVTVVDVSNDVALLDDRKVLHNNDIIDIAVDEDKRLLSQSDGWILSSDADGNLTLQFIADKNLKEKFELKKTVATASVKDDILAVLFADNEMALYSIATKEILLKEQGGTSLAVDSRVVKPYFLNDLVIFSTLDGKIVIINASLKKKLRTTIVSSEDFFNNIIYFDIIDDRMIAATSTSILSLATKEIRVKYELRNITYEDKTIFIATKQGEILSLTPDLQVNAKVKFPFAHFLALMIRGDKLYALEKEGYLIELSKDLLEFKVYEADIDDGYVYTSDRVFHVDDNEISVE